MRVNAIFGEKIISLTRKYDPTKPSNMVTDNKIKLNLKRKGNKGGGRWTEAFVEKAYSVGNSPKHIVFTKKKQIIQQKLKELFDLDYNACHEGRIKGDYLIGECDKYKAKNFSHYSASHGGNKVTMESGNFVVCYVEPAFTLKD